MAAPARRRGPPRLRRYAETLTPRELGVLRYLDGPDTTDEIAAALHVSRNTVKSHMAHLYLKLGVHSRRDAVRAAGLVAPPVVYDGDEVPCPLCGARYAR